MVTLPITVLPRKFMGNTRETHSKYRPKRSRTSFHWTSGEDRRVQIKKGYDFA